jgi:hypothetical protein
MRNESEDAENTGIRRVEKRARASLSILPGGESH